jgi:hypothetical protein
LTQWEGSVTRCSGVMTLAGGEAVPRREREEITSVEMTQILLDRKMNKIHVVDSASINGW